MLRTISNKALSRFWTRGDPSGIRADWVLKVKIILDALNAAAVPDDMNLPGFRFHSLKGDRAGYFAVSVSRNWRITFRFDDGDAVDVDLEDYHA